MPITGTAPGTNFCQISSTTSLLNGTLNVTITGGYLPVYGNNLTLLTYTNLTGTFSKISLPLLNPGLIWGSFYKTDHLEIDVINGVFIPFISKI